MKVILAHSVRKLSQAFFTSLLIIIILGVPLTDGATVRLQAVIGLSRTLDMVLTGRSLNAEEAFQWGLANKLVACGTG